MSVALMTMTRFTVLSLSMTLTMLMIGYAMLHSNLNVNFDAICHSDYPVTDAADYCGYLEACLEKLRTPFGLPEAVLAAIVSAP